MIRTKEHCAMCSHWTLKEPGADPSQGIGHCTRFLNEINLVPRFALWNDTQCIVFGRAQNVADREAYISKMTGATA